MQWVLWKAEMERCTLTVPTLTSFFSHRDAQKGSFYRSAGTLEVGVRGVRPHPRTPTSNVSAPPHFALCSRDCSLNSLKAYVLSFPSPAASYQLDITLIYYIGRPAAFLHRAQDKITFILPRLRALRQSESRVLEARTNEHYQEVILTVCFTK